MMNLKTAFSLTLVLTLTFAAGLHASSDEEYGSDSVVNSVVNQVIGEDEPDVAHETDIESADIADLFDHIFADMKVRKKAEIDLANKAIASQTEQKKQEQLVVKKAIDNKIDEEQVEHALIGSLQNEALEEKQKQLAGLASCIDEIFNLKEQELFVIKVAVAPKARNSFSEISSEDEE